MDHDHYPDAYLRDILESVHRIAVVGASKRPQRPSHGVMRYLQSRGYRTIPVNPNAAGERIHGELCFASLDEVPGAVDMADIFRRSDAVAAAIDDAIRKGVRVIWLQLGLRNDLAAARAEAKGIRVVMDRCPAIEIPRLGLLPR